MKAGSVIGKRIARIDQRRFYNRQTGRTEIDVLAIVLDDGTELRPITVETRGGDYAHDFAVVGSRSVP